MLCNILCVVELEEKRFIERAKVAINTSLVNAKEEYQRGDVVVEERNEDDYAEAEDEGLENNGEEQKEEGVVEEDKKDEGVGTGEVNGEEGEEHVEAEVQAEEGEGEEGKQFVEAEMQVEGGNDEEQQQQEEEQQQQEDADVNENVYEEDRKEIINEDENGTKVEIHEEKRVENQDGTTTTTVQVTKITKTVEIQETKQIIAEGDDNVEDNDEIIEGEHQAISVDNENDHNSQQPSSSPVAEGGSGGIIQLEEEN